jgi:hypothetical protein
MGVSSLRIMKNDPQGVSPTAVRPAPGGVKGQRSLQRFTDPDLADHIVGLVMQRLQRCPGFFFSAGFQLRELEAAFVVELVLDDVFGRLGHGFAYLECGRCSVQFRAGTPDDFDLVRQGRLARDADGAAIDGVDGNVPETGARCGDPGWERVERTAMVTVPAAILETAKVGIAHQADVAGLGALDDNDIVFVEVLALVDEFHGRLQKGFVLTVGAAEGCDLLILILRSSLNTKDQKIPFGSPYRWATIWRAVYQHRGVNILP